MNTFELRRAGDSAQHDRRSFRSALVAILAAVTALYFWYCAPISAPSTNAALVALLAVAAAVWTAVSLRSAVRPPSDRLPRPTFVAARGGVAI